MDDFFESLKQNLKSRKNPEFKPEAWERMQKKIKGTTDGKPNGNKWPWLYFLVGLLLLSSLGANYYLYHKLSDENSSITDKTASIEHLTDTIYKERIINHTDTIYKIKNHFSKEPQFINLQELPSFDSQEIVPLPDIPDSMEESLTEEPSDILYSDQSLKSGQRKDVSKVVDSFRLPPIQALTHNLRKGIPDEHSIPSQLIKPPPFNIAGKEKILSIVPDPMISEGFLIGLHGGASIVADSKIESSIGGNGGMQVLWGFRERWRLTTDVDFNQISFETEFPEGFPDIPKVTPPSDGYELDEIDVEDQSSLQLGLGVQYLFDIDNKLQPYVWLGWNLSRIIDDTQIYEFTNLTDTDGKEIIAPENQYKGIYHHFFGRIGMEYTILPLWRLQVDVSYKYRLRGGQDLIAPPLLGLRLGILRSF